MSGEGQSAVPRKRAAIIAIRMACLACLGALVFVVAPPASRSQSTSVTMQVIAGDVIYDNTVYNCELPATSPISLCNEGYHTPSTLGAWVGSQFIYAADSAVESGLFSPITAAAAPDGSVYIADQRNSQIRKVDPSGKISTYALLSGTVGSQPFPWAVVVDHLGNVYYSSGGGEIDVNVQCSQVGGTLVPGGGTVQGGAVWNCQNNTSSPQTNTPQPFTPNSFAPSYYQGAPCGSCIVWGLAVDGNNDVYALETTPAGPEFWSITEYDPTGAVVRSLGAGSGLSLPVSIAVDSAGNIFAIDSGQLVKIGTNGSSTVLATSSILPSTSNEGVNALAVDSQDNLYALNFAGNLVYKYDTTAGTSTVVAGTGTSGFNNPNDPAANGEQINFDPLLDGPFPATQWDLNGALGISLGPDGNLYIADTGNSLVRKVNTGSPGCMDCGPATLAITDTITRPLPTQWGINPALHKIYMITSANPGVVSVFSTADDSVIANIPIPGPGVSQTSGASTALSALAVDPVNNLVWVGDTGTNSVWVINSNTDTLNPTSVALPAAPLYIGVDTALDKAYVTNTEGGYSFPGLPAAVTAISGPSGTNPPAVVASMGASGSAGGALPGASAIAADPQRHFVYVRYFGPSSLGYVAYWLAVIDSTKDQIVNTVEIGQSQFQSTVYPDSMAVDETNGQVLIGDDYDQYVHLYDPSTQQLSGFFGGTSGFAYHTAVDSYHGVYYTWDGYGNSGYLVPNQTSGSITTTSSTTTGESTVAVDQSTDQAYVLRCNSTNGDGTLGTLTLFDGSTQTLQTALPLEIPSGLNNESEGCGGLLVDASNSNPAKHSAWTGFEYQSQDSSSGVVTSTGQIDVINGATPAARPSISVIFGPAVGIANPAPFQDVGVGQTASLEVRIKNGGPGPLNSIGFDIQDLQDPGSLQIANSNCAVSIAQPLPAGGECSFDLTFTPSQVESFSGAVLVLDNAGDTPQSFGVIGTGVPDTGALTIAPNVLSPGVVGQSYSQVFSASGLVGTGTWSINGTLPPDLVFSTALHSIVSSPNVLSAADVGTWNFTISVTDSANGNTGSQLYSLTITSTASGQATASVTIPGSSGNANTLAFGRIEVDELSATQQIKILNSYSSLANLQIGSVMLTGPNASDFTESDNCVGQSLSTGQSCALNVTFLPTVTPTANEVAEIVIGSNAAIAPIYLTGTSAPALGAPSILPLLVSADNGNPANPAIPLNLIGCYPPECGAGGPGHSELGGVSSGGKFAAFSFLAGNLPGPVAATTLTGGAASGAYRRSTCLDAAPGTCEEATQFIAYGPTLGTAPGSNGGKPCEDTTTGGSSGSYAKGIDSTGEFVLFESDTCGFGGSNSTNANQVYLRDALYGNTTLLSVDRSGMTVLDHGATGSSMSTDARFFAFQSASTNAANGFSNPNSKNEVYWRDTCLSEGNQVSGCTPQTQLVSQDNASDGIHDNSFDSSISANGRYVVFGSYATMLNSTPANNDTTGLEQIYIYDTCAGAPSAQNCTPSTKLISVDGSGNAVGGSSPSVSSDGRFVAFLSGAATLLPVADQTQYGGTTQVYLADTCTSDGAPVNGCTSQPPILVSQYAGAPGNLNSSGLSISGDGQLITFTSAAQTLPSGGLISVYEYTNCLSPAAPSGCVTGLQVISLDANGNPLQGISGGGLLDPTGQYFIFGGQMAPGGGGYNVSPEVEMTTTTLVPPPPAIATFSPFTTGIDFPNVNVGTTSPTAALELTDTGAGPLHVYLMSFINDQNPGAFNWNSIFCNTTAGGPLIVQEPVSTSPNLTIGPGMACVFNINMTPPAPGTFTGSINFATNASASNAAFQPTFPGRSQESVTLTGTSPAAADLSISALSSALFGTTGVNVTFSSQVLNHGPSNDTNTTVTYTFSSAVQFESFSVQGSGSTPNSCNLPAVGTIITSLNCDLGPIVYNGSFTGSFSVNIVVAPAYAGQLSMTATVSGDLFDPNTANNTATSSAFSISLGPANVNDSETIHVNDQEGPNQSIPGLVAYVGDPETVNVKDQAGPNQSIAGLVAYVGDPETINVKDMEPPPNPCSVDVSSEIKIARSGLTPKYQKIGTSYVQIGYTQTLTLTNTTASTISGPFEVVFGNLPSGISVEYTNGTAAQTISCNSPAGAPYLTVSAASLAPNTSATLFVLYYDPAKTPLSGVTTRVLAGTNP